jgi:hypothetical protein
VPFRSQKRQGPLDQLDSSVWIAYSIVSIAGSLGECDAFANATLEDGPNNFLAGIRDVLVKAEKTPAWTTKSGNA